MWLWHLELSEIEAWFEAKAKEFTTFPSKLHSWVERLADSIGYVQSDRTAQWNQAAVQRLQNTNNIVSRVVDYWLTSLLSGFIIEFTIDTLKAYTEAEC